MKKGKYLSPTPYFVDWLAVQRFDATLGKWILQSYLRSRLAYYPFEVIIT
jgi:hypothetical protein